MSPPKPSPRQRLDLLLVSRGLAESRQRAQALILAGQVYVNAQKAAKPGERVPPQAAVEVRGQALRYASRGGLKLEGALEDFALEVRGRVCLAAGSSTGGFTDCLLQRGAARVYAVDVNIAQLAWKLRQDARVTSIEANARYLKPEQIGAPVDLAAVDVSFISVRKLLPALAGVLRPGGDLLILVKPQFELSRTEVGRGGIVRDPALHRRAVESVRAAVEAAGFEVRGVRPSRIPGAEGNLEFFLHARKRR